MTIRIATAPVSWGVMEVKGWARQRDCAEVLDEMVEAGYAGTELGPYGFFPTDPKVLGAELKKRNLSLLGAFVPLPLKDRKQHAGAIDSALEVARLLAACGAPLVILADEMNEGRMQIAGHAGKEHGLSPEEWRNAAGLVSEIAGRLKDLGLRSAFHHHGGTFVETPEEIDTLLSMTDPALLGLCLDTGHYYFGGGDPLRFAQANAGRVWHLHLKDVRPDVLEEVRSQNIPYLDAIRRGVFCELGEGGVDVVGVIRILENASFDGWGVFEQDVDTTLPGADPLKSAAASREYLRKYAHV